MNFDIVDCVQKSDAWRAERAGLVTGSCASSVRAFKTIKGGARGDEKAERRNYRVQLLAERLTGKPEEAAYVSKDMRLGNEREPIARALHQAETGLFVRQTGFLRHKRLAVGCSLDGDIDNFKGISEYKCPRAANHLEWMLADKIPEEHEDQVIHNLWVTGADWCDFVSYNPDLPEEHQLFIKRVMRADADILSYEKDVRVFLAELDNLERKLRLRRAA